MTTPLHTYHLAARENFAARVHRIGDGNWAKPTPCSEWTVRDLLNHLVYENLWVPELFAGKTVDEVGDRYEGDCLGDDPIGAWDRSSQAAAAAVEAADLDAIVHLSFADLPGRMYLDQLTFDLVVHGWDLARGIGEDDTIDPDHVQALWDEVVAQKDMIQGSGMFGTEVAVPAGADLQTRVLGLIGRAR